MIWEEDMKLPRQQFVRLAASAATLPAASLVEQARRTSRNRVQAREIGALAI
jgi:hypothetical protein